MEKTKILIVDDRPENIISLEHVIATTDANLEILKANSGHEALGVLLDHDIGLCLLDVQMPEMSGIELAKLMRGTERYKRIPIIFVTAARSEETTVFEGYNEGAVDFLTKPLAAHIVRSKVRVFVELDQQKKMLQAQVAELTRLKLAAESANCAKSQFLANMSHEIRTPLTAVLGFSEFLIDPSLSPEERLEHGATIMRNGEALLRLVDDILDLSKIEAGCVEVAPQRFALADFIQHLKSGLSPSARNKHLDFELRLPDSLPSTVLSDPLRLRQILNNVVGNAIKFTSKGFVTITISVDKDASRLTFTVEDSGCGMNQDEMGRIFSPFMQADNSTTRVFGGTGLGLAISRQLAQALGGDVTCVSSQKGKGSTFAITVNTGPIDGIPWVQTMDKPKENPAVAHESSAIRLDGTKVLLVEDSADNRLLISRLLQSAGAEVTCAENGLEGIDKALGEDFNLVLMDIQMPGADGYEATRALRRMGYQRPIIALTAHALREEQERSLQAGYNAHLTKPVDRSKLLNLVASFHMTDHDLSQSSGMFT